MATLHRRLASRRSVMFSRRPRNWLWLAGLLAGLGLAGSACAASSGAERDESVVVDDRRVSAAAEPASGSQDEPTDRDTDSERPVPDSSRDTVDEPRVPAESAAAPTTTAAPVTTVPPTTAPVPVAVDDQATLTAGEYLTQNITGNALRFSYVEPGNVLHGWHDFYTIAYCTDGSTAVDYYGERTTILDNKEYDSSYDIGQWFVDDRGGGQVVLVHDYGYSGLPIYGFVNAQGQLLLDPGWSWQVLGPAGC